MAMWVERDRRLETGSSVSTLLNDVVLERNRTYMRSVAEIIVFLATNRLSYRGKRFMGLYHFAKFRLGIWANISVSVY